MVQLLADKLVSVALDPGVLGVVISGEGKAFSAGGDLKWINGYGENHGAAFHELAARYHQAILEIRRMPKPVVAAINGPAAGGGFSIALACDFRIMEASATLRQAYTSNGLSIDGGGTFALPRLVGLARAMEIAAFDQPISAETALSWGLVTEVVEDGEGMKRAIQLVEDMKKRSLSSFAASKRLITDSFDTKFETQLEKERELLSWCADLPNGREGIAAFLEKRKPVFGSHA
jgi:2-(1,2-epoxy-1,2-dihydrophenyl)acetyl-CoA isomerase